MPELGCTAALGATGVPRPILRGKEEEHSVHPCNDKWVWLPAADMAWRQLSTGLGS